MDVEQDPTPRPVGRPSKYDPAFCDKVIELMRGGVSFAAVAGALGVSRQTIYEWAEAHPEFSYTKSVGKAASQLFWERRLIDLSMGIQGNASAVIFALKNRASLDWRDMTEVKHDGGIVINVTPVEEKL